MRLSAYIVRHDTGFSPNPFGGICTLACCKPSIRRAARRGDIIVGSGSASHGLSGRLVYAMRVETILPFDEYWVRFPSRRPSLRSPVKRRGDNIWHRDSLGHWRCAPHGFHDEGDRSRDIGGHSVLMSRDFYYFGRSAIGIPQEFLCLIAVTQGHRNTDDALLISEFWKWVSGIAFRLGRSGLPAQFGELGCDVCDCLPRPASTNSRCG